MPRLMLLGAASLAALALAACGENNTDVAANTTPTMTTPDSTAAPASTADHEAMVRKAQDFVNEAGQAGLVEIKTSEIALKKTKNAEIKKFAQMMLDDHKAAGDALKAAASAAALAPPPETLDDFHMRRINDIVETDGDQDFDADYINMQVDAHNDAIKAFEDYSKDSNALAQVKDFADKTMPTLTAHKTEAERIRDLIKKTSAKTNPS